MVTSKVHVLHFCLQKCPVQPEKTCQVSILNADVFAYSSCSIYAVVWSN